MMKFDNRLSDVEQATKWWWVFLITGALWLILSVIVFRFDATTVAAVGALIAVFVIMAGVNEFMAIGVTQGGWKWAHIILGGLFIVFGVAALFYPGRTFWTMASIMSFVLIFKGGFDIFIAFMTKGEHDLWWLQLITGIVEIALAFWAAAWFGREVILLVAFVGGWCLIRGITEIILAFQLRSV